VRVEAATEAEVGSEAVETATAVEVKVAAATAAEVKAVGVKAEAAPEEVVGKEVAAGTCGS
jgi:hypothetical protein